MKQNVGSIDKVVRIIVAILFSTLYFTGIVSGVFGYLLLGLGAIFILTSVIGTCPLYLPFGLSSSKKK